MLNEARKQKFLYLLGLHGVDASQQRRIWTNKRTELGRKSAEVFGSLSVARSLIWIDELPQLPIFGPRLLRLYETHDFTGSLQQHLPVVFQRVNLRYINIDFGRTYFGHDFPSQIPSSISLLWNLQTLVLAFPYKFRISLVPFEIWKLPQLRHVNIYWLLIEPPNHDDDFVLENLQTLDGVMNLKFGEEMAKKIPNLKKLKLNYMKVEGLRSHDFSFDNIRHLSELKSLTIDNSLKGLYSEIQTLILPHSLKKLTLYGTRLPWELMKEKVGSLPSLERIELMSVACVGREWITVEDQFLSLKLLEISGCRELECWETKSSHFPRLEHVVIRDTFLKEIPSSLGDITTLRLIRLYNCLRTTFVSAKRIREEQQELGNQDLQFDLPPEDDFFLDDYYDYN